MNEPCAAVQLNGPEGRDHHCVGDRGHVGDHWCLLGHVWESEPKKESSEDES
jgi:hypothetical protein